MTAPIGAPSSTSPALPAMPKIDIVGIAKDSAAPAGAMGVAVYGALKWVDKTDRASSAADAASSLLAKGTAQMNKGFTALAVGGIAAGAGATEAAGVKLTDDQRKAALVAGVAGGVGELVHLTYSPLHYPHGGAFQPFQMAENLAARYARVGSEVPEWVNMLKKLPFQKV